MRCERLLPRAHLSHILKIGARLINQWMLKSFCSCIEQGFHQFGEEDWEWQYNYAFGKRPAEELYDLRKDPDEIANCAEDPAYAKQKGELSARLMEILTDAKDPRMAGDGHTFDRPPFTNLSDNNRR